MATTNVRLKDAAGNVLHPETDWSLVQNKPSITVNGAAQGWVNKDGSIVINGKTVVFNSQTSYQISDKLTNGEPINLNRYPIEWSAIAGKTTKKITHLGTVTITSGANLLYTMAVHCYTAQTNSGLTSSSYYYFYNGSWETFTPNNTDAVFTPLEWVSLS